MSPADPHPGPVDEGLAGVRDDGGAGRKARGDDRQPTKPCSDRHVLHAHDSMMEHKNDIARAPKRDT